jgi:hypothetical protein
MNEFKIGDRVVTVSHPNYRWRDMGPGLIGVIAGPLESTSVMEKGHYVEFECGIDAHVVIQCLRKIDPLPPKREELGSWNLCPWQPVTNNETV